MMYFRDQTIGTAHFIAPPWCLVRLRLAQMFSVVPPDIDALGPDEIGRICELLTLEHQYGRRPDHGG